MMESIKISDATKKELTKHKLIPRESYDSVITRINKELKEYKRKHG